MFGYVRPVRQHLQCGQFDLYQATYCGLCRCMRRRYGLIAPMFLNYDFTFLALLLWPEEQQFTPCLGRCHANLLRRRDMCQDSPALELAADESVILAWWKLRDSVQDDGFWKGLVARAMAAVLYPAYKKAARLRRDFDQAVCRSMKELSDLESAHATSIDRTADTFARLLQAAAPADGAGGRALAQLLYHLGRWIYLIDARDDWKEDALAGRYNPVSARFGPEGDDQSLKMTMDHSLELIGAAFELVEFGCRTPVLENIIYLGLPLVQRAVFDGSWEEIKKQKIWSNRR